MIKNNNFFINTINNSISIKSYLKKNLESKNINNMVSHTKIKVVGNFFKLKFLKKKKLVKFNLCLAHKVYLFKNKNKNYLNLKKIKKNKIILIRKNKIVNKNLSLNIKNCTEKLRKKRVLNSYTKKGIKLSNKSFKSKVGKKTTYT